MMWCREKLLLASLVALASVSLTACGGLPFGLPGMADGASPTPSPTAQTTPATPTAAPATPKAPEVWAIGNTGGDGAYVRRTPAMADRLKAWPDGTVVTVVGPDTQAEGRSWKRVRDPDGNEGWIPTEYLIRVVEVPARKPGT